MHIHSLFVRNFRNHEETLAEFSPQVNVICGANAQGKTSLLEAIFLCVSGRSFRTSQMSDMVRQDQPHFTVEVLFVKNKVEQRLRISYGDGERRILYNNTPCMTASSLLGILHGVVMTPDDIGLIKDTPQVRRHYLDLQISQIDPLYLHHLTRYHKAMRQRNQLLRQRNPISIESWESEMASAAAYIVSKRAEATTDLMERAQKRYDNLSDQQETLELTYKTSIPPGLDLATLKVQFIERYQRNRPREMDLGLTLVGPHKDDLVITINGQEARCFASEGQQRCCAIALRLAEYDRMESIGGFPPLMLVDDIGISLDDNRRNSLLNQLAQLGQVFVSSATDHLAAFPHFDVRRFQVHGGNIIGK